MNASDFTGPMTLCHFAICAFSECLLVQESQDNSINSVSVSVKST